MLNLAFDTRPRPSDRRDLASASRSSNMHPARSQPRARTLHRGLGTPLALKTDDEDLG